MRSPLKAFLLAALLPGPGWASFSSSARGTTAAQFLKLGVGARAVAMGEAYSALADEASALYWNPAALTRVSSKSFTFMHAAYVDSSFFDYAAYAQNLGGRGALGGSLQYLSAGRITETDDTGTDVGTFLPNDLALTLGYSYEVRGAELPPALDGLSLGLAAKFIRSTITRSAQTGALDLGVLSPGYMGGRLRLAFTVTNLGGQLKFDQEYENLPLALRLGSAYKFSPRWAAALDLGFPRDNDPTVALGAERLWESGRGWTLAGRAGFNSRSVGDIDGLAGFNLGFGVALRKMSMDYGFAPLGSVGLAHRISLSFKF